MDLYGLDSSLFEYGFNDPALIDSISRSHPMITDRRYIEGDEEENLLKLSTSILKNIKRDSSPPKHRHDGTSPLPLGMDWSPPPRKWDGMNTIWPHDFHTGWSYCVTVPSWSILAESRGSESIVYYRVQVGLQSPEGVSTTRGVLRRFSDFLKLASDLKQSFHHKRLPPAPPKGLLRMKNRTLLEERRCYLEDWMAKVLSDIDVSRSAPVACFIELEAAARSSFEELSHHDPLSSQSHISVASGTLAWASNNSSGSTSETSEIREDLCMKDKYFESDKGNLSLENDSASFTEATINEACSESDNSILSKELERPQECTTAAAPNGNSTSCHVDQDNGTSSKNPGRIGTSEPTDTYPDTLVVLPLDEQQKISRLFTSMQQRLGTSQADTEDLIARLNQELAVRQYLTTKVNDLETELESSKQIGKENLEHALFAESERFTQLQWDMQGVKRERMEIEERLRAEQACAEEEKASIVKENEALRLELDSSRKQLKDLQKYLEEVDLKSKSDVKLLVREVKTLRSSQVELKQELDKVSKQREEFKTRLQKERTKRDSIDSANRKLLHECATLRSRLEECSANFLVKQEFKLDTESPPNAVEILATSENRIVLLLAEAQLIAQEVATQVTSSSGEIENMMTTNDELRKMLADILIDNAILRKQANSIIRRALDMTNTSPSTTQTSKEDCPTRKAVISNFLFA